MILLSFDIEEFDLPREYGVSLPLKKGIELSNIGAQKILDILKKHRVKATFFCTGNFARLAPGTIKRIVKEGHEVACHGVDHWRAHPSDPKKSKKIVEKVSGRKAYGYRQPRMFKIGKNKLKKAGYLYDSSLNPTIIPGRYNHASAPRTPFLDQGILQIPTSVTPGTRIPLFWLSLHHFPEKIYYHLVRQTLKKDHLFTTYFHPWEFLDLKSHPEFKIPWMIHRHSGPDMEERLDHLISMLKKNHQKFTTYHDFAKKYLKKSAK